MEHNLNGFEKLDGISNFHTWKFSIKNLLILEGLWEVVVGTDQAEGHLRRDQGALARICLTLKPHLFQYVRSSETAKDAWKALLDVYEDKGLYRRVLLLRRLHRVQYSEFPDMQAYIDADFTLVQQLDDIGKHTEDEEVAEILLSGLPTEYDSVVSNLSTAAVTTTVSSELVRARLLQEYSRKTSGDEESAAYVSKSRKVIVCEFCKKSGHKKSNCFKLKKLKKARKANDKENEEKSFSASAFLSKASEFYIDSGATSHMVNNRDILQDLKKSDNLITMADNSKIKCEGIGTLEIQSNLKVRLLNVLYVPQIAANLISVSKLVLSGHSVRFSSEKCFIYNDNVGHKDKSGNLVASGVCINGLFKRNGCVVMSECVNVNGFGSSTNSGHSLLLDHGEELLSTRDIAGLPAELWHRRLGHLNIQGMKTLEKVACGMRCLFQDEKSLKNCLACLEGKLSAAAFPDSTSKTTQPLQLIHSDVCGPMQEPSWSGAKYIVTFTDDYTRKSFACLMKNKFEDQKRTQEHIVRLMTHQVPQLESLLMLEVMAV